jgi:8-oxo-dGTP pyrophosphatase MutT (NUDIX family)
VPEPAAPAKPAATVVLVRDRDEPGDDGGIEVLLLQRHKGMKFMGGVHVFPGGTLSDADVALGTALHTDAALDASLVARWGKDVDRELALGLAVTAIRETFEEAGLLLMSGALSATARASARAALLAGEPFEDLLAQHGLQLDFAALRPLSRWITPKVEPRRYDTRFFVARAPRDQVAEHDAHETVAKAWLSPDRAIAQAEQGIIRLSPPTARTLHALRAARDSGAALAVTDQKPPPTIEPMIIKQDGDVIVVYPGDPDHPVRERALDGPTRQILVKS